MSMLRRNAAVLLVAGLVLGGGAFAYAQGAPDRPTFEAGEAPEGWRRQLRECREERRAGEEPSQQCRSLRERWGRHVGDDHRHLLRGAVRAELVVPDGDGGWRTVVVDRGTVVAVDGTTFTLRRPDQADPLQFTVGEDTKYRGIESIGDLDTDERAAVVTDVDGKVLVVAQRPDRHGNSGEPASVL